MPSRCRRCAGRGGHGGRSGWRRWNLLLRSCSYLRLVFCRRLIEAKVNSNTIRHQLRHVATMTEPPLRTFGDALADENLCRRPARFIAESNMARPDNLPDRRLVTGSCAMIRWTIINVES